MILQLSLFQIFFMALSIVGLSFCILYLFIGGYSYDSQESINLRDSTANAAKEPREIRRDNVYDISSGRRARPAPTHRTSVGRQSARPSEATSRMQVLEVDYKIVHHRGSLDDVTLDAISQITDRIAFSGTGTGRW